MKTKLLKLIITGIGCANIIIPQFAFANNSVDNADRSSLLFAKTLSIEPGKIFYGQLVSGDADCEDEITVSVAGGLHYNFGRAAKYTLINMQMDDGKISKSGVRRKPELKSDLNDTPAIDRTAAPVPSGFPTDTQARRAFILGHDETDGYQANTSYSYYRSLSGFSSTLMVEQSTDTSVEAGEVCVIQNTQFKDVTGIWQPFFYSVVEKVAKKTVLKRLPDGDLQYFVREVSNYAASKNEMYAKPEPAGTAARALNCRYRAAQ